MSDYSSGADIGLAALVNSETLNTTAPIEIRVAGLIGKDYLLLLSRNTICQQQAISELLPYLADDLLLEHENVEVITVHPDTAGNPLYCRFNIRWFDSGPQLVPLSSGDPKSIPFIETLIQHSISFD